jgi:glyoxylate reductase
MKVYVTRRIPEAGLDMLKQGAEIEIWPGPEDAGPGKDEVIAGVKQADLVLSLLTEPIDREVMLANPDLLGVSNYAVGFNNIDIETATELGLPITNTPGVLTETTADLTMALLLSVARQIVPGHEYMSTGKYKIWGPQLLLGHDVSPGGSGIPKTLGLVGFGRIGQAVWKRAKGFDLRVVAYDPPMKNIIDQTDGVEYRDFPDLLKESDFISLHVNLTPESFHLINDDALAMMKPSAYIINTSRGPAIDEAALVRALKAGQIAGAGLDVYENEPAMAPGLAECDNVVLLPHLGSGSRETRDKMATMAATNALALLKGEKAPNTVNPEVYDTAAYLKRIERLK